MSRSNSLCAAFAAAVHEADPSITIDARNTRGSAENIPLLEASKLDHILDALGLDRDRDFQAGKLGARLAQARESTARNTYSAVADRELIHPGVRRYLRDAGIARD